MLIQISPFYSVFLGPAPRAVRPCVCGWRADVCESLAQIDGGSVGKGVGAGEAVASRGQEELAKGPAGRLQERAEPGLGDRVCIICVWRYREGARCLQRPRGRCYPPVI